MSRNLVIFSILKTQATTKQQQNSAYSAHSNFNLPKGSFFLNWSLFAVDRKHFQSYLSLVLLLITNLTNELRLHQFLVTKSAEANKSVKTDANRAH